MVSHRRQKWLIQCGNCLSLTQCSFRNICGKIISGSHTVCDGEINWKLPVGEMAWGELKKTQKKIILSIKCELRCL